MTEEEYAAIAAACDRLLRAPGTSLARIAIAPLHLVNEHPGCLAPYAPLLRAPRGSGSGRRLLELGDSPRAVLRAGRALARSLRKPLERMPVPGGSTDVVIVSHLANPSQLDEEDDFYFGALQRLLRERGTTSVLVLINHLPNAEAGHARVTRAFPSARLILPRTVSAGTEARIWQQCLMAQRLLRQEASHARQSLDGAVAMLASRHALSRSTAGNLRLHASLSQLTQRLNPRIVMTTYEGDSSERLIWHAARSANRRPLCVGYQHARLLERAHAIRRSVGAAGIECDPDVVLTLGEISNATLAASPGL